MRVIDFLRESFKDNIELARLLSAGFVTLNGERVTEKTLDVEPQEGDIIRVEEQIPWEPGSPIRLEMIRRENFFVRVPAGDGGEPEELREGDGDEEYARRKARYRELESHYSEENLGVHRSPDIALLYVAARVGRLAHLYGAIREETRATSHECSRAAAAYFAASDDHPPHAELPDT